MDLNQILNLRLKSAQISYGVDGRPQFSYAQLIAYALLESPEFKLSLTGIYDWICSRFAYYRLKDKKWKNSIRHNLSLQKCFEKTDKCTRGKGSLWTLNLQLVKEVLSPTKSKPARKASANSLRINTNIDAHSLESLMFDPIKCPSSAIYSEPASPITVLMSLYPKQEISPAYTPSIPSFANVFMPTRSVSPDLHQPFCIGSKENISEKFEW